MKKTGGSEACDAHTHTLTRKQLNDQKAHGRLED